ncbi:hypothetical protein A2U01_0032252 [Trifolium medium]|uniref:Uncharacterized protein n=1 Tax=Trifolium medium TaxID=97028 RepID=A0A392PH87_9FABA|nr:hypothetical protein [Trifolium medium]
MAARRRLAQGQPCHAQHPAKNQQPRTNIAPCAANVTPRARGSPATGFLHQFLWQIPTARNG